jgi:methyltransferase (TIGR00027 family)
MQPGKPSSTAAMVAALRALALDPTDPSRALDPLALDVMPRSVARWTRIVRAILRLPGAREGFRSAFGGLPYHLELRTQTLDAALRLHAQPGTQIVLLGAGYDTRAWRMTDLAACTWFEVDHPDTQARKLRRLPEPGRIRAVAVDFATSSFPDALAGAGHDRARPTLWVWEGVTPYLPPDATSATLFDIRACSAPGSHLWMSWIRPRVVAVGDRRHDGVLRAFARVGEPLIGGMTDDEVRSRVEEAGLRVCDDGGSKDWAARLGHRAPRRWVEERVLHADVPA